MRGVLRALAGIVLVAGGVLSLTGGAAAWAVGELRSTGAGIDSEGGAFITNLAPVHTDGYVIVVPDAANSQSVDSWVEVAPSRTLTVMPVASAICDASVRCHTSR